MSSLSAALNTTGIDDDVFWEQVAAHFRENLGRMVCVPMRAGTLVNPRCFEAKLL